MRSRSFVLKTVCAAAALLAAAGAQAAITMYTSQIDFRNAILGGYIDSYDNLAPGPLPASLFRVVVSTGYRITSPGGLYGAGPAGTFDYWLSNQNPASTITFSELGNLSGFGANFFTSDAAHQYLPGGTLVLSATDADGTIDFTLPDSNFNSFVGFLSDGPLASVTVRSADGQAFPSVNLAILAVPEPSTGGMLLAGLGVAGWLARPRRGGVRG